MRARLMPTVLSVLIASYCAQAAADSPEDFFDLSPASLSKIRVTAASAFAETALDSSATVSVIQRSDWEQRGARTLPEAVMNAPGVMLLQPPAGGMLIQVRSYDSTSLRGRATLVDGVPINTFAFGSEVFSDAELQLPVLDSIELVRGPSSILYGSDAFHSALILSTYRSHLPEFEASGETGTDDYDRIAMRGTKLLGNDQSLQMAVAGAHQGNQHMSYPYLTPGGALDRTQRANSYDAGTGMVRWEGQTGGLNHALELFVDKTDANQYPGGGSTVGDTRNHDVADHNAELWILKGELSGDLVAGWDWRWDAYYWRNDYGQTFVLPMSSTLFYEDEQQFVEHRKGTSARVRQPDLSLGSTTTQLALTAGYEEAGIDDHKNQRVRLDGAAIAQPTLDYSGLSQSIRSLSLEGKTRWDDDHWQFIYGGRVDDYSTFGTQSSPRLGVIWIPAPTYSFKLLYGEAFRAPNANELRGTNFVSGDTHLKPETLDSYELVYAMASGNWRAELVGFKSNWHDRIILTSDATALNGRRYANIGESEARGVEASLAFTGERWQLALSGSGISNRNITKDTSPSVFPHWILNLGAGYRWPEQRLTLFVNNRVHQDVKVGDQSLTTQPLPQAGLFFRTDVTLSQQWSNHWSGQLTVRNLFDRDNIWPTVVNSRGGVADIPRQISVSVKYRMP